MSFFFQILKLVCFLIPTNCIFTFLNIFPFAKIKYLLKKNEFLYNMCSKQQQLLRKSKKLYYKDIMY